MTVGWYRYLFLSGRVADTFMGSWEYNGFLNIQRRKKLVGVRVVKIFS